MSSLFPILPKDIFDHLSECTNLAEHLDLNDLRAMAIEHTEKANRAYENNPLEVNAPLACAIMNVIDKIVTLWNEIPDHAKPWFKGMIKYYITIKDNDHDFYSLLGFDDDVEVINACLRLAGIEEYCINPEDFDGVS